MLLILIYLISIYLLYYFFIISQKPKIYSGNSRIRRFLKNHVRILKFRYFPPMFLWDGRLQTILRLTHHSKSSKLNYKREILNLSDGGQVALDYLDPEDEEAARYQGSRLIVLILPGLMNSSQSSYIKSLALAAAQANGNVVVFNFRGLGGVPLKTPRSFSGANCDDLVEVIAHLKGKFPNEKMIAVGTSMGGMVIGQYLIKRGEEAKKNLQAAILLSTVYDSWSATRSIEKPWFNKNVINIGLGTSMARLTKRHIKCLETETEEKYNFEKINGSKTVREFDTNFTCPQFGYNNVAEYYKSCSLWNKIHRFPIPVFGLSAMDDPMQPGEDLPFKEAEAEGSNFALIVTSRGGHLAFLQGLFPSMTSIHYMERVVAQFVHAIRFYGIDLKCDNEEEK